MILAGKLIKVPEFLWYLPKNLQNSRILHDFCPKMPEFYIIIARKHFFPNFRGARAPHALPSPTPMIYSKGNTPNFSWNRGWGVEKLAVGVRNWQYLRIWQGMKRTKHAEYLWDLYEEWLRETDHWIAATKTVCTERLICKDVPVDLSSIHHHVIFECFSLASYLVLFFCLFYGFCVVCIE